MDVVVVNTVGGDRTPHWSAALAGEVSRALVEAGARVRWICALPATCAPPEVDRVAVEVVVGKVAPFRRVAARVEGDRVEIALARALRDRHAEQVVVLGPGAPGSCEAPWVADRMGADVLVGVRAREVLCHRQDLSSEDPEGPRGPCSVWDDPWRCVRCCRQLSGPGRRSLARMADVLGGVSPFPNPLGFANRLENVIGGLLPAAALFVETAAERDQLAAAGLPARRIEVAAEQDWPALIAEQVRGAAEISSKP